MNLFTGFENTRSVSDILKTYKHVYHPSSSNKHQVGQLVKVSELCRGQEGTNNTFIRNVRTAPDQKKAFFRLLIAN